jgi:peptidoglycan/LPS O-acetylase OafA/YrhL
MGAHDRQRHISSLDGLRGLAVIAVLAVHANGHFGGPFAPGGVTGTVAAVCGCGWVGVDLFFVLSGFLITGILCDARGAPGCLRNFYARRTLRIVPLSLAYLSLVSLLAASRPGTFDIPPLSVGDKVSLATYIYNFRVALVTETPTPGIHHFWSLAVEEHFYLLWPMLVLLVPARPLMRLAAAGAAASLALRAAVILSGAWLQVAYLVTPCRLDGLLAGSFVALALRDEWAAALVRRWARPVALGAGCLLLGLALGQRHFTDFADLRRTAGAAVDSSLTLTVGIAALALFFAAGLVLVLDAPPGGLVRRFLESRELTAVGRYSYGMYVLHEVVLRAFLAAGERFAPGALGLPGYVGKPALIALLVPACFAAAYVSYHAFEKYFLNLKRFFDYRAPAGSPAGLAVSSVAGAP